MLNIDVEYKRGVLFVRLDGILNKNTSCILEDVIEKIINKAGIKYMLLNLEKLYSIDISGIDTIIESYKNFLEPTGKLIVCGYKDTIKVKIEESMLLNYALYSKDEISVFNIINI